MSATFAQSDLLGAHTNVPAERELDLEIVAIAQSVVRVPYGSMKMNLCAMRDASDLRGLSGSAVRVPYGALKMNLAATRDVLVIAGTGA